MAPRSPLRAWWTVVSVVGTVSALVILAVTVDAAALLQAFAAVPLWTWGAALALYASAMCLGVQRWRILLRTFGATNVPAPAFLARAYLVGFFYNTCLPGGLGGDVVRGVASRKAFANDNTTGGLAVVFVERLMGVTALLLLASGATFFFPLNGMANLHLGAAVILAGIAASLALLACAPRLSKVLPRRLARVVAQVPIPGSYAPFLPVLLISLADQACVALCGHLLIHSMVPAVALSQSLAIIPVAAASAILPFTMAGIGVREAAFVTLYGTVGVNRSEAVAGSVALFSCQLFLALVGGLVVLFGSLDLRRPTPASSPPR